MNFSVIFVLFFVRESSAVIYRLNASAYAALPALLEVEDYAACRRVRSAYCSVDARLVANETSELLNIIQEFSEYSTTHYDRRVVHRGMCTRSCRAPGASRALRLEACLNDTLYRAHRLQSKVIEEDMVCTEFDVKPKLDSADYAVAALALLLLLLVAAGTLQDLRSADHSTGGRLLSCFSLRQNWRRLVAPSADGPDAGLRRLKCFNGIKFLTTAMVIFGHSPLALIATTRNPDFFETRYHSPLYAILYNGTLIVQTFFVLSGFLLAYNVLRLPRVSWGLLPKGILLRWLRLTPPYAAVIAFVCTWQRHVGSGPFWQTAVEVEVRDCRRDWFYNLLYVNNYIDNGSQCIAQAWYLAADMQLSALGLAVLCACAGRARARLCAAAALLALGALATAAHTYYQDLNAVLLVTPEVARKFFVLDPTFNNVYRRGHTNLACYAVGLLLGDIVLRLQARDFDISKYKKYRIVIWAFFPAAILLILSGAVFYTDGVEVPLAVRVLYASTVKILFGVGLAFMILGFIFKLENLYRRVVEWRGWAAPARAAYCAFLVHAAVLRNAAAAQHTPVHSSLYIIFLNYLGVLAVSFLLAFPCWLVIEAPCGQLIKFCFTRGSDLQKEKSPSEPTQVLGSKDIAEVRL